MLGNMEVLARAVSTCVFCLVTANANALAESEMHGKMGWREECMDDQRMDG